MKTIQTTEVQIPTVDRSYVKPLNFSRLSRIVESNNFFPVYIQGESGEGKTLLVEQVCAAAEVPVIRVNISIETDEEDLIGGYVLQDGNIVFRDGPVLTAMRTGSILLLDEVDRGSNKLMCLQSVLEGSPYFIKKTGETVTPARGFNVIATANTKGTGAERGDERYISAQILDEAFMERFAILMYHGFPDKKTAREILARRFEATAGRAPSKLSSTGNTGKSENEVDMISNLVDWADGIRKAVDSGAGSDIISIRRLVHIIQGYHAFGDIEIALDLCLQRYVEKTKNGFIELFNATSGRRDTVDATTDTEVSE